MYIHVHVLLHECNVHVHVYMYISMYCTSLCTYDADMLSKLGQ